MTARRGLASLALQPCLPSAAPRELMAQTGVYTPLMLVRFMPYTCTFFRRHADCLLRHSRHLRIGPVVVVNAIMHRNSLTRPNVVTVFAFVCSRVAGDRGLRRGPVRLQSEAWPASLCSRIGPLAPKEVARRKRNRE